MVGADVEQVIVVNRDEDDTPNKKVKFERVTTSFKNDINEVLEINIIQDERVIRNNIDKSKISIK